MTPLEKAARALCAESFGVDAWSFVAQSTRDACKRQARAVLMAVREPDVWLEEVGEKEDEANPKGLHKQQHP